MLREYFDQFLIYYELFGICGEFLDYVDPTLDYGTISDAIFVV